MTGGDCEASRWAPTRRSFIGGALLLAAGGLARADADYLDGQTLRIMISSSGGSSADAAARLFAKHLARLLPDTRIAVENVTGAGGRLVAKELWEAAPDGLTVAFLSANIFYSLLLDGDMMPFVLQDFGWIGGIDAERRALVLRRDTGVSTVAQLRGMTTPLLLGCTSLTSGHYIDALLLNVLLDTRLKPVVGYTGGQRQTALIAGELQGNIATWESVLPAIEAGVALPVLRLSPTPLPPPWGDLPGLESAVTDPRYRWVTDLIEAQSSFGRSIAAPPRTDPLRLQRLRALFQTVVADPAFVAAATAAGIVVQPSTGQELNDRLASIQQTKGHLADDFKALLACGLQRAETGKAC